MKRKKISDFYRDEYGVEVSDELAFLCEDIDREIERDKKRKQREPEIWSYEEGTTENAISSLPHSIDEEIIAHEEIETLRRALTTLTETQKRRIIAHYVYGLSQNEIARNENKRLQAIQDSIEQGLKKLKIYFEKN